MGGRSHHRDNIMFNDDDDDYDDGEKNGDCTNICICIFDYKRKYKKRK